MPKAQPERTGATPPETENATTEVRGTNPRAQEATDGQGNRVQGAGSSGQGYGRAW